EESSAVRSVEQMVTRLLASQNRAPSRKPIKGEQANRFRSKLRGVLNYTRRLSQQDFDQMVRALAVLTEHNDTVADLQEFHELLGNMLQQVNEEREQG
ncbi:MAG: hypothetical protein KDE34_20215, partial [Anaerolineales bacterium]|nr:hypothetical protein [Anaerolineales bacterium]